MIFEKCECGCRDAPLELPYLVNLSSSRIAVTKTISWQMISGTSCVLLTLPVFRPLPKSRSAAEGAKTGAKTGRRCPTADVQPTMSAGKNEVSYLTGVVPDWKLPPWHSGFFRDIPSDDGFGLFLVSFECVAKGSRL